MPAVAIRIDAQDALGAMLSLGLVNLDLPELGHLGGEVWEPALIELPVFAMDFFGGGFSGQVTAPTASFAVATTGLPGFGAEPALRARFADARVRVWVGDSRAEAMTLRFDGRLTGEPAIDDQARTARFDAAVQDSWADEPLLALFAGTGGIEGPADLTGQVKPLTLGNVLFAGGVLIDSVDNVWMVNDGPVEAVSAVFDRLASLGPSAGDYADLAALLAAEIPNGSWATALAQGLVRLGAPPDGRVSFHVSGSNAGAGGYVRRPGAMIRRIVDRAGGSADLASLAALDLARPFNLQLQLREQVTPRELIARIADSAAAVAGVSLTGHLFAQPLGIAAGGAELSADGTSAIAVLAVEELAKASPAWRLATEAELTAEVHSADEAAFSYRWQGEYSETRVYRMDDVVTGPDSAAWAYINAVPAAGEALPVWPVTANAHWRLFQAPGGAGIGVDAGGVLTGIATPGVPVDNGRVVLEGAEDARPGGGNFVGQLFSATDTGNVFRWTETAPDAFEWELVSDITSAAIRTIEPEFPTIEIRIGEAGNVGTRTVSHVARRGTVEITGGTWSIIAETAGVLAGTATINSATGIVSLSGIGLSGSYTIRYTHTDGVTTDLAVNVTYIPNNGSIASSVTKSFATTSFTAISNPLVVQLPAAVTAVELIADNLTLRLGNVAPEGETSVEAKWQRETSPGTWGDVGSAVSADPQPRVDDASEVFIQTPGQISVNETATGLTAGSLQTFRLVARITGGNTRTVNVTGTVTAGA